MIIVYTFKNKKGQLCLDYGVDTKTDKKIILPPEELDCDKMGIKYNVEGCYCWMD